MFPKRGVHPPESKLTEQVPIKDITLPERLILHLKQHIGKPCEPIVKTGQNVKAFQRIAENDAYVSAHIHSPVDGKVLAIENAPHPDGTDELAITIEPKARKNNPKPKKRGKITEEDIIEIVRDAGIVGLGGAMFPTHVKLTIPKEKRIDTLILNGSECEPFLTADSRMMQEKAPEIIQGAKLIMKAIKAKKCVIAIEKNKSSAIEMIKKHAKGIKVKVIPTRYPQGAEKVLIRKVTKRTVPSGGLPLDVGVVVCNTSTAFAVYEAVTYGKPLIERVVTVTGDVKNPSNLRVPLGTPFNHLIKECGGIVGMGKKIICGGPMMGLPQVTDNSVTIKGNNGIIVFNDEKTENLYIDDEEPCIRCGKCVDSCPAGLAPTTIARYSKHKHYGYAKHHFALDCFECGCCSYVCPSKIDLVGWIKIAKKEICKK